MIPKEILSKVRRIEIRTGRLVQELFGGEYRSVFKGRGIEFSDLREYTYGDDIRTIDWNVTARTGRPFIKKYVEERELTIMFLVDISASGDFGTVTKPKAEIAAELCSLLALSALRSNDKVGLILFSDRVEKFVPPRKGRKHVLRVVREVLYYRPQGKGTDIAAALRYFSDVIPRSCIVFLMSDFFDEGYERLLKITNQKHDCIAIQILDPRERALPNVGMMELVDAETQETALVDTSDREFRNRYETYGRAREERFFSHLRGTQVDVVPISTEAGYVDPLIYFFKERERKFR
ncbi:MAG: DUF58 domain-containing protein [Candidatus Omnitrophica bacterium]|nr:DUF58 domain-containing protein [Candidatus Omnitrophota bacterium]